jgi:hypothetical protein
MAISIISWWSRVKCHNLDNAKSDITCIQRPVSRKFVRAAVPQLELGRLHMVFNVP